MPPVDLSRVSPTLCPGRGGLLSLPLWGPSRQPRKSLYSLFGDSTVNPSGISGFLSRKKWVKSDSWVLEPSSNLNERTRAGSASCCQTWLQGDYLGRIWVPALLWQQKKIQIHFQKRTWACTAYVHTFTGGGRRNLGACNLVQSGEVTVPTRPWLGLSFTGQRH